MWRWVYLALLWRQRRFHIALFICIPMCIDINIEARGSCGIVIARRENGRETGHAPERFNLIALIWPRARSPGIIRKFNERCCWSSRRRYKRGIRINSSWLARYRGVLIIVSLIIEYHAPDRDPSGHNELVPPGYESANFKIIDSIIPLQSRAI